MVHCCWNCNSLSVEQVSGVKTGFQRPSLSALRESFSPWVNSDSNAVQCVILLMTTRHLNQHSVRKFLPSFNSSVLERTRVWRSCKDCYQILFPCFLRLSYSRTLPLWSWLARENTFCGGAGYWGDWTHHHHPWSDKDNNNDNFNKVPTMMFQGLTSNKVPIISRSVPLLVPVIYLLTYDHGPVHIIRWIAWCTRHFCNTTKQICGGNLICYFTQQFTRVSVFSLRRAPLTRGMPLGFSVLLHEPVREVLKTWALYSVFYVWDVLDWIMHLCGP